jgi:hypothetical protein
MKIMEKLYSTNSGTRREGEGSQGDESSKQNFNDEKFYTR